MNPNSTAADEPTMELRVVYIARHRATAENVRLRPYNAYVPRHAAPEDTP